MKNGLRALAGLVLGICAPLAGADEDGSWLPKFDGEASLGYDSNVTRAEYKRDIIDDGLASASASAIWNHEIGMMKAATLRAFVDGEAYRHIDTLNRTGAGVQGIFRWQNRLGFTAPFYQASLSAQHDWSATSLRDDDKYVAQLFVTRRLTDEIRGSLGVEGSVQQARDVVFDLQQERLFANADWEITPAWAAYGTYSLIGGDTVSSAQQQFCDGTLATDTYDIIAAAKAIESDVALNNATCGHWVAYRLKAITHAFVLGVNRGFGHNMSLDISAQHVMVFADGGNDYRRTLVRAGILARF